MNTEKRDTLLSEKDAVERLLARLPDEDEFNRIGLEGRLKSIQSALDSLGAPARKSFDATLTFEGGPVINSYGISAEFGGEAAKLFVEAVETIAASRSGALPKRGPAPHRGASRLVITDVAKGSFGFKLEEYSPEYQGTLFKEDQADDAIGWMCELLNALLQNDERCVEKFSLEVSPRAFSTIRQFLAVLDKHQAMFSVSTSSTNFRFSNVDEVKLAIETLAHKVIQERTISLQGQFIGVLPKQRSFEFEREVKSRATVAKTITGKIDKSGPDPNAINKHLGETVTATFLVTQRVTSRTENVSYTLLGIADWLDS